MQVSAHAKLKMGIAFQRDWLGSGLLKGFNVFRSLLQPSSPGRVGHLAYSLTQRGPEKLQVGHLAYFIYTKATSNAPKWVNWLIHSHTQTGPKMVQVGHLAYSFIYTKGDQRWSKWVI